MSKTAQTVVTAADLIRQKHSKRSKSETTTTGSDGTVVVVPTTQMDNIDDEIQRLEAELNALSDDDLSVLSDDDDDGNNSTTGTTTTKSHPAVLSFSAVKDERIERLPAAALPAPPPRRRTTKRNIHETATDTKRDNNNNNNKKKKHVVSQGLTNAVREVLRGYQPRSAEHLPLYCRCCAKQYDCLEQFQDHKRTEFHKTAVELERKASYCKLCRKQLTSPAQLKEHLQSRPHHERLRTLQTRQQQRQHPRER
jgi:uncharacterized CHY-type Zn-finger protein